MNDKTKIRLLIALVALAAIVWYWNSQGHSKITAAALSVADFSFKPLGIENPELQRAKLEASRPGRSYRLRLLLRRFRRA
jgi:hypothetical protein